MPHHPLPWALPAHLSGQGPELALCQGCPSASTGGANEGRGIGRNNRKEGAYTDVHIGRATSRIASYGIEGELTKSGRSLSVYS